MQDNQQQQLPLGALLAAVVLMFGVIWSHDTGLARSGVSTNRLHSEIATNIDRVEGPESDSQDFVGSYDSADLDIPIPEAPGRYRLVNNRGFSTIDSFTVEELTETGIEIDPSPKNLYEIEHNGIRWYYIRLDSSDSKAEEAEISTVTPAISHNAAKPDFGIALPRMLLSSFDTVRSSISSGYRLAADGVKTVVDHMVRTPARSLEKLAKAIREREEEKRFPVTLPFDPSEIDTASSLDSIFY